MSKGLLCINTQALGDSESVSENVPERSNSIELEDEPVTSYNTIEKGKSIWHYL